MIREANMSDLDRLVELAGEFHAACRLNFYASFDDSRQSWCDWITACIQGDRGLCLVSTEGGVVVGFTTAVLIPVYFNRDVVFAQETVLWVEEAQRNKGHGRALLAGVEDWGRAAGAKVVASGVSQFHQPKAVSRLLRSAGYKLQEKAFSKRL